MNRVEQILTRINLSKDTIYATCFKYANRPRGEIFNNTVNYHKRKIKADLLNLENLGKSEILTWVIRLRVGDKPPKKFIINLDSSFTYDEIFSYFSNLYPESYNIQIQKRKDTKLVTGFPSLKRKSKK